MISRLFWPSHFTLAVLVISRISLALPALHDREIDAPSTNGSTLQSIAAFEQLVGNRLRQLEVVWRYLRPWAISVEAHGGHPSVDIDIFTEITIAAFGPTTNQIIVTDNTEGDPAQWEIPSHMPATPDMHVCSWLWTDERKSLVEAWQVLRRTTDVPILRIVLVQFLNGPPWGPHRQQYYIFYPNLSLENVLAVGASDGNFYTVNGAAASGLSGNATANVATD